MLYCAINSELMYTRIEFGQDYRKWILPNIWFRNFSDIWADQTKSVIPTVVLLLKSIGRRIAASSPKPKISRSSRSRHVSIRFRPLRENQTREFNSAWNNRWAVQCSKKETRYFEFQRNWIGCHNLLGYCSTEKFSSSICSDPFSLFE